MFLRCKVRRKDGKQHRYWSVVENTRTARGRVVQRHVLYLGEINDTQELAWRRSIEVLEEGATQPRTLSLFPEDRFAGALADASIVLRDRNTPQKVVWRARIVLLASDGLTAEGIAAAVDKSLLTVRRWRRRFVAKGMDGLLKDATRPSRVKPLAPEKIKQVVHMTLHAKTGIR